MDGGILQPIDYAGRVQQGFALGQQQRRAADMDKALQALAANPQDPAAIAQVTRYQPALGLQLQERRAAAQQKQAEDRTKLFAHAARAAKTPQQWDAIASYMAQNGIPEAANVVGKFSPEMRIAYMAQAGLEEDKDPATSIQRNYEFFKQLPNGAQLAEQYVRGQAEGSPIVVNNGDGTFTIVPRSMVNGQQAQAPTPPPPPGFVLDSDGGPTPPASGGFPPGGY